MLEQAFLELCRRASAPAPSVNVWLEVDGGLEVDFYWPDRGLIVEVDGFETHRTRSAFKRDRRRDRTLRRVGFAVERFSWDDVFLAPVDTTAEIVGLMRRTPPTTPGIAGGGVTGQ